MSKLKDLTGQKFGRLTVIERSENKGKSTCWRCRCDCGNEVVVSMANLCSGHTKSCGCLQKELPNGITHGMTRTKTYHVWASMKARCLNTNDSAYKGYGGRGITIYPEWINNFQAFYDYVSKLEHFGEEGYSLDRINNDGNYEPNNLRWADRKTQNRNQRKNHIIEYNGDFMTVAEVSEKTGINPVILYKRIKRGDTGEKLFREVEKNCKPPVHYGEESNKSNLNNEKVIQIRELYSTGNYSQKKLSEIFGVSDVTIGSIVRRETWKHI